MAISAKLQAQILRYHRLSFQLTARLATSSFSIESI